MFWFLNPRFILYAISLSLLLFLSSSGLNAQRLSRDLHVDILINHAGYLPGASKICISKGDIQKSFEVINLKTQKVVYTGQLFQQSSDFGNYIYGDFSSVTEEGSYYIKADTLRSYPFRISNSVYQPAVNSILNYFSLQRCGASTTGYLSPCHLDDGVRVDNGKHKDVTGGWHDASDLRKWVSATIYGMIGLTNSFEFSDKGIQKKIIEELIWGNQYFLKMQEPDGFVMDFIGGDVKRNLDNNRWTDNLIGEYEEVEAKLIRPNAGFSTSLMLTVGNKDDRVIQTNPADMPTQFRFISSEAAMSRITRLKDAVYSKKCLDAAMKCFEWCRKFRSKNEDTPEVYGTAIQASLELFRITKNKSYKEFAAEQASLLKQLQADSDETGAGGYFYCSLTNKEPYKQILGSTEFISLCDLALLFPKHKDAAVWKKMISRYVGEYLLPVSKNNIFGIIPYGLYSKNDTGGGRRFGKYYYRYFMEPELNWWVGINSNLASAGIGFIKAAKVLKNDELRKLAQRQLDWIMGNNPFNSCTIVSEGYNNPPRYNPSAFIPATPLLAGAVMNGIGGDHSDQPFMGDGIWQVSEYWTPMAANTFWLIAELNAAR
ncbi:MAG: glycoside hydrolase family 9 protein [Bacteroidota bacterium]|nr:glycoside hydrolase family 9 protein [Bacteroidota bacterium]MDP4197778.1 glycoside hydrolase family 9 protein [Bacteroidota bacterium]